MKGETATLIGTDERFVVNPLELIDTWTKFVGGKLIERGTYRTIEFEFAPDREALGDMNEETLGAGSQREKRKDPWSSAVYLPMKALSDGELVCFKATGQGAIEEIAELCGMYASADRGGKLPVIEPTREELREPHGSMIYVPVFKAGRLGVLGGRRAGATGAVTADQRRATTGATVDAKPHQRPNQPHPARNDMDDEIPF